MTTPPDLEHSAGAALVRLGARGPELLALRVRARAYELPKGHLEPGESAAEAALRELAEETNLLGVALALAPVGELRYELEPAASGRCKHVVYFVCVVVSGEVAFGPCPSRTRERRWLTGDELDALPLVNEALRPIMRAALAHLPLPVDAGLERCELAPWPPHLARQPNESNRHHDPWFGARSAESLAIYVESLGEVRACPLDNHKPEESIQAGGDQHPSGRRGAFSVVFSSSQ